MFFWSPVLLMVLIVVCFLILGAYFGGYNVHDENVAFISLVLGVISISLLVAFSPLWNPSCRLLYDDIDFGTYKVGFVYVAGENINVAVEWEDKGTAKKEHIYHYQFKRDAFEGIPNPNAKKLVVVQSGNFKKLRLE